MLVLVFSLCIPLTAFGQAPGKISTSEELPSKLIPAANSGITQSPNLLKGINSFNPKKQSEASGKGPVVKKEKQKQRFIQNAVRFVKDLDAGNYQQAVKSASRPLKKTISAGWMETYWTANLQQLEMIAGPFIGVGSAELTESNLVHTNVEIELQFEHGSLPFILRMERSGKVDDFFINQFTGPFAELPAYGNPDSYTEKDVVVGKGDFALPGTLSIPEGKGRFPVIVLVQGSGASDKDETAYALKPFRDLAHGLASEGIAVLRYNKRTFEHAAKTMADPNHTVEKETTDDALAAVQTLKKEKKIDDGQIFILGHSQGGMMVPQMLDKDTHDTIAGAVVMGGPARTIQDVVLDQFDYLFSIGQLAQPEYNFYKEQFSMLNDPNFSGDNPPEGFQLGQPVFWDSINDIRAAEMAKDQSEPLLIIQGERDYQVMADSEIPIWQEELSHRNDVEFQLYPKLNHFFTEGEGEMSTPYEYLVPANIPDYVINDIAEWIHSRPSTED
ncbi:alpha/beta fold hydrolase [Halobacillus sp. MO56]